MTNKNSSSKIEAKELLNNERQLLPRLQFMGYLLMVLGALTFTFALFIPSDLWIESESTQQEFISLSSAGSSFIDEDDLLDPNPLEVLNFYIVASSFVVVGALCFLIVWKKRKTLLHHI